MLKGNTYCHGRERQRLHVLTRAALMQRGKTHQYAASAQPSSASALRT